MRYSQVTSLLLSLGVVESFRSGRNRQSRLSGAGSLLAPIDTRKPDATLFPPDSHPMPPANTEVAGAKHTNKFWGNWVVDADAGPGMSIYPSPYTLRWSATGGLNVMKGETDYQSRGMVTHYWPDFIIGAAEVVSSGFKIVKEQHFGIHARVQGSQCSMTFPIYAGMAYPSARYEGGCTPTISSEFGIKSITKVRAGVWRANKDSFLNAKEYGIYLLTPTGEFVDNSYDFDAQGRLNKQHNGWVRIAQAQENQDFAVLDEHAQTIVVGWELQVDEGVVKYNFETVGPTNSLLHWAYANHMQFLSSGASLEERLTRTRSPVKGKMFPLVGGNQWTFTVDLTEALNVDFLPQQEPKAEHVQTIIAEAERDYEFFTRKWRMSMHKRDHYFSGKGFQKIATVCHVLAKFKGKNNADVQECANIIKTGFQCMYQRNVSNGSDRRLSGPDGQWSQEDGCWWSPFGSWYDESWGGIPSRWINAPVCGLDFGNGCYNDHHYHWGYYVVAAAQLVDLIPSMANDVAFVDFINMFIRDAANPSTEDVYFPQFRAFDWFDMHSWSRGLKPHPSGKDQESTSEEVNLHYGMVMWGKMIGNEKIMKLGATILTVASAALQDYFLMKRDNPNHPAGFSKNHVTGIFFQNMVTLSTWFGGDTRYIHGIQMLPLTAGLELSRKDDFAFEEWTDQLKDIPINVTDPWWSILLTGNLAMHSPDEAYSYLIEMEPENYDDGLTKSWALYWTSTQKADGPRPTPAPVPTPAPGAPPINVIYCAPGLNPPQYCPGQIVCPSSGVCP